VINISPQFGEELEVDWNPVEADDGREVDQHFGQVSVVDRQSDHQVDDPVVAVKVSVQGSIVFRILPVSSFQL
jgi:hypothetical protein